MAAMTIGGWPDDWIGWDQMFTSDPVPGAELARQAAALRALLSA